jgi:hypothetical protein
MEIVEHAKSCQCCRGRLVEYDLGDEEADHYFESIAENCMGAAGSMWLMNPSDYRVARYIRAAGVPLDIVLSTLAELAPKRRKKSLAYYKPAIMDAWKRQQELMAPAAGWEGYEHDAPKSWRRERDELSGKIKATIDYAELPGSVAGQLWGLVCETVDAADEESKIWRAWVDWKREAAEIAAREKVEPGVVGEIIRTVEA